MFRIAVFLSFLTVVGPPAVAADVALHVLKKRIIRSLAIDANDPSLVLVGQKAGSPGSALVFRSRDGGRTWRTLNGARSLNPAATDVQAVLSVSPKILLAGTWKHGLYRSEDSGNSFEHVRGLPSADIRDLQIADGKIYAATARDGVLVSTDTGRTWKPLGPGRDFLWSLTAAGNRLFASSPEKAVYARAPSGPAWRKIFDADGANAIAITPGSGGLRAIAGAKGLHISGGKGWRRALGGENFGDVIITRNNRILAGSWKNGIAVVTSGGNPEKRILAGKAVIQVQIANRRLFAGTWGDGLHILPLADILSDRKSDTPLIAAVRSDDPAAVQRLIRAGANIDAHDAARNTALIYAARDGQTDIARMLIDAGADPGWVDGEGVTPLILAAFKNHPAIVKLLLAQSAKARIDHTDKWGRTAREYALRRGADDPILRLLSR